jgi:hypothetical protein
MEMEMWIRVGLQLRVELQAKPEPAPREQVLIVLYSNTNILDGLTARVFGKRASKRSAKRRSLAVNPKAISLNSVFDESPSGSPPLSSPLSCPSSFLCFFDGRFFNSDGTGTSGTPSRSRSSSRSWECRKMFQAKRCFLTPRL